MTCIEPAQPSKRWQRPWGPDNVAAAHSTYRLFSRKNWHLLDVFVAEKCADVIDRGVFLKLRPSR